VDGVSKNKIVGEIGFEMVVCFAWMKIVLRICDGAIVYGQPFWREEVGGVICGLCGGGRRLDAWSCFVSERTVETTFTGSTGPIKGAFSFGNPSSVDGRYTTTTTTTAPIMMI
jgi:hypothetical protein